MSEKKYFRSHLAVSLVLIKDSKILLGRRCNTKFGNGEYGPPAGHIDGNESASTAIAREAKEEIGISIDPKYLKIAHIQHLKMPEREYVSFYFSIESSAWTGEPKIMEPNKCDDLQWFPLNALPENISPNVRSAIENYKNNIFYSEFGWDK